ncbi:hypothetical protein KP509_22G027100 [Ceratopteris richardii]|uniref:Uncharacterized protein n=1 Tax=Ceratopteris richardii TaxID=49495 RepID=A0A8T2S6B1_CERRI|nr:hypothetical protein KP509_22G027100 [Ceratopteris richardii]
MMVTITLGDLSVFMSALSHLCSNSVYWMNIHDQSILFLAKPRMHYNYVFIHSYYHQICQTYQSTFLCSIAQKMLQKLMCLMKCDCFTRSYSLETCAHTDDAIYLLVSSAHIQLFCTCRIIWYLEDHLVCSFRCSNWQFCYVLGKEEVW